MAGKTKELRDFGRQIMFVIIRDQLWVGERGCRAGRGQVRPRVLMSLENYSSWTR